MPSSVAPAVRGCERFAAVLRPFQAADGLPFAELLTAERIEWVFGQHDSLFATNRIYGTAVVLWAFLGQMIAGGKQSSCQSAVARITSFCLLQGTPPPTADTGSYCRARAKLSPAALRRLSTEVAGRMEDAAPPHWQWRGSPGGRVRETLLVDGFTCTMADTPANQKKFPQPKSQSAGIGFPIMRAVVVLSLATAAVVDVAFGPYQGKETGETALLRQLFAVLRREAVIVFDRYYCSYMMIGQLHARGHDVCCRLHQKRTADFRKGKRLGRYDRLVHWTRPVRPSWMDQNTYNDIPATLTLRMVKYDIIVPGRRTEHITIVTTLIDPKADTIEALAELYGHRWHSELDIRAIKQSLSLDHIPCKTPAMVASQLYATLLAYNLVRGTAAAAALVHQKRPRQISFTATCQYLLECWLLRSIGELSGADRIRVLLNHIANCQVGHRPGRLEPRVLKRRRHRYPLMNQPRHKLRADRRAGNFPNKSP